MSLTVSQAVTKAKVGRHVNDTDNHARDCHFKTIPPILGICPV